MIVHFVHAVRYMPMLGLAATKIDLIDLGWLFLGWCRCPRKNCTRLVRIAIDPQGAKRAMDITDDGGVEPHPCQSEIAPPSTNRTYLSTRGCGNRVSADD